MPMEEHNQCPDIDHDGLNTKNQITSKYIYNQEMLDNLKLDGSPKLVELSPSFKRHELPVLYDDYKKKMEFFKNDESASANLPVVAGTRCVSIRTIETFNA